MSYRAHSKKPSLPSIQFILEDTIIQSHDSSFQDSVNSTLPSELQQLSLSAPIHEHQQHHISWISPNKRPSSHSRSFSDLTAIHKPLLSLSHIPPSHTNSSRSRYQTHKRSISANISTNTIDFFKNSHVQHQQQQQQVERALSESPPITLNQLNELPEQKLLLDALNITETTTTTFENIEIKRDEETGKYYCPFCRKSFNRPSSLKIHTYSHTGEKPFICPINGCGRQFSVQSNMRRHLRIHKKSKIKK